MPFKSVKQERYMQINRPALWKRWVKKYGHHPGYAAAVKKGKRKGRGK